MLWAAAAAAAATPCVLYSCNTKTRPIYVTLQGGCVGACVSHRRCRLFFLTVRVKIALLFIPKTIDNVRLDAKQQQSHRRINQVPISPFFTSWRLNSTFFLMKNTMANWKGARVCSCLIKSVKRRRRREIYFFPPKRKKKSSRWLADWIFARSRTSRECHRGELNAIDMQLSICQSEKNLGLQREQKHNQITKHTKS